MKPGREDSETERGAKTQRISGREGEGGLEIIFLFKYLGSIFVVNGSHDHDVTRRACVTLTMKRSG